MKGNASIYLLLLPLLLWAGCSRMEGPGQAGIPDHCIEITISNLHPSPGTRATSSGIDDYNENLVKTVDCFFYTNGATGSDAVFTALGRGAEPVAEGDSTVYRVRVFFTDSDANKIFGSTSSGTCELFVICNAPLSYGSSTDVATLKELVVENDFTASTVQGSFVMSSTETSVVTLSTDGGGSRTASGRTKVSRAAAKIQFYLYIPETFLDEENHVWEPVLSAGVDISMANAVKRGKVDGDYSVQNADYVSYGSREVSEIAPADTIPGFGRYLYTHVPFYSYPSAWTDLSDHASTVVFRIAWREQGGSDYIWKKYQLSPNVGTLDFKRNHFYRTFVAVHSLGGADKEEYALVPECDYQILPWIDESTGAGQGLVPGNLITYKYLVVDEPEVTLDNEITAQFTYVTSSPISKITFTKVVYYDNSQASPLRTYTFTGTSGVRTGETGSVTVNGSTISYSLATSGLLTVSHSLDGVYSPWEIYATITNEDNCTQDIIIVQNPSIALIRMANSGNIFVNGYFARMDTKPTTSWGNNTNRYSDQGSNWYHCTSFWSTNNTRAGQVNNSTQTKNGRTTGTYGTIMGSTSNLDASISTSFYTTEVSVSAFNSSNDSYSANGSTVHYRIGDPRVPSSAHYNGSSAWTSYSNFYDYMYYNGQNTTTESYAAWQSPEDILITSQAEVDRNVIAPYFLVSSALNANTGLTFDQAVKRAATYQAVGYPAGRWRIPSEAEMAFIVARQNDGTIPTLYATGSPYWSGSGRLLTPSAGGSISFSNSDGYTHSVRFVYDLWYWGTEASTTNTYHPNGHLYDYDSSGNATAR